MTDNSNGDVYVEHDSDSKRAHKDETTLYVILRRLISSIFFPDNTTSAASTPLLHRIKASFAENAPLLPEASRNTATNVLQWTRRGSPLRALLVISVSTFFSLISLLGFYQNWDFFILILWFHDSICLIEIPCIRNEDYFN